jgi:DNA-binding IclR family transcriptional regulator
MLKHGNHQLYGKVNNIAQRKILRVFDLINLLAASRMHVHALAKCINTHERTVYRYFNLLEEVGFCIERDTRGRYYMTTQHYPVFVHVFRKSITERELEMREEAVYG